MSKTFSLPSVDSLVRHCYASHRHRHSCTVPRLAAALSDRRGVWATPQSGSGDTILLVYDAQQMVFDEELAPAGPCCACSFASQGHSEVLSRKHYSTPRL